MVIASHVIFTAYGFWLPNDPRGSWSDFVGSWELYHFGPATKTELRNSLARTEHDRTLRRAAKTALKFMPVEFTGVQARAVGHGFAKAIVDRGYRMFACSILPAHVHAVIGRHERDAEDIVGHLKFAATRELCAQGLHPFEQHREAQGKLPTMWTKRSWKVFLDSDESVLRAIGYVEGNPVKEGKPVQRWSFVLPYKSATAPRTRGG